LKAWILEAQNQRCFACDSVLNEVEFDHVVPLGLAGSNSPDNWAALCGPCHRRKTASDLRKIAKAKRQRRYHETGRSRAPSPKKAITGFGLQRHFDRCHHRGVNGVVIRRCGCPTCAGKRLGDDVI
jgi:hypothetical protein